MKVTLLKKLLIRTISSSEYKTIHPGGRALVSTGLTLSPGVVKRISSIDDLVIKCGIQVGASTIDDRGELQILLFNHSIDHVFKISPRDEIAYMYDESINF